jgi:hypothetical protein
VTPRVVWVDSSRTHAWTDAEAQALADTTRARLIRREVDEYFYYNTRYGSPLAYLRPIEILAAHGLKKFEGVRLMDFGYGTAGHLRLMASLGADVVGVEVDPSLRALYSQPGDQGKVGKGKLKLVDGQWPATQEVRDAAGEGFRRDPLEEHAQARLHPSRAAGEPAHARPPRRRRLDLCGAAARRAQAGRLRADLQPLARALEARPAVPAVERRPLPLRARPARACGLRGAGVRPGRRTRRARTGPCPGLGRGAAADGSPERPLRHATLLRRR